MTKDRPWEYKPLGMPLWKFFALAFVIALMGIIAIGLWTGVLTLFLAKHNPFTWPTEVDLSSEPRLGLSPPPVMAPNIKGVATGAPKDIHPLDRNMTADVGQYQTMEAAQSELLKLKHYLLNCQKRTLPFSAGLIEKASVQEVNWPGDPEHITYFLVIKGIDDPTFYALCDYMWNSEDAWARQTYHRCTDFDHRDDP
jgi:hypothetical protein